jgi:hypothetical protein
MHRYGLFVFAIVLCASTVLAQGPQANPNPTPAIAAQRPPSANPEPWRIIPKAVEEPSNPNAHAGNENPLHIDLRGLATRPLSSDEIEQVNTCYYIRSYLMTRDSKDSDATHLVGTSTCQPARHYSVKTTDPQPHTVQP